MSCPDRERLVVSCRQKEKHSLKVILSFYILFDANIKWLVNQQDPVPLIKHY